MDFVTKFEKALRKKHQALTADLAKVEHLIDAFEKGAKRGAKRVWFSLARNRRSPKRPATRKRTKWDRIAKPI